MRDKRCRQLFDDHSNGPVPSHRRRRRGPIARRLSPRRNRTTFPTTNAFPEPHPQGYSKATADGTEAAATDWNPAWGWAAGAMISTLDDMRIWAPALATGVLLSPAMQTQRLQTLRMPGQSPGETYGLGTFNLGGWIGHNGSVPGYQAVSVYLPKKQTTLVILTNTDISYQGSEPCTPLATAVTTVLSPDHVYTIDAGVQRPSATPSPTTKARCQHP